MAFCDLASEVTWCHLQCPPLVGGIKSPSDLDTDSMKRMSKGLVAVFEPPYHFGATTLSGWKTPDLGSARPGFEPWARHVFIQVAHVLRGPQRVRRCAVAGAPMLNKGPVPPTTERMAWQESQVAKPVIEVPLDTCGGTTKEEGFAP